LNNAELIEGLRKRDPAAARYLNDCFVPSVWRFVFFRVNRDRHLTEDIVAETVLALMSSVQGETTIESPAAWLRTVALRRIQDHYRAAARVQHLIERVQPQSSGSDQQDPAIQHDQALDRQEVREAMEKLPEHYRAALEWKYVDQLSVAVIATRFDTTEKGVEALLFRARRALRSQLQSEQTPPRATGATKVVGSDSTTNDHEHRNQEPSPEPPEAASHEATSILLTLKP
jgi:RNA polymerase sigma factor (sigma-70 family)